MHCMGVTEVVAARPPGFLRRHKALSVLVALSLVLAGSVFGWAFYLNHELGTIPRFDSNLDRPGRPARVAGKSVNFLLVGVDDGFGTDLSEMLQSGNWTPGVFRSDTIMVLHLNEDRSAAELVSIPRDSYVPIEGHGTTKINAAFSYGGPDLLAKTVEDYTGIYVDHIAVIDLDGFRGVTKAIGGVDVYIPQTVHNSVTDDTWTQGTHHLEGDRALRYVRQRYGLPGGDFDRIQRQQNFLRSVLAKVVSNGVIANPLKLTSLVRELSSLLVVDDEFSAGTMRSTALASRGLGIRDLRFVTVPYLGTATIDGASVVKLDGAETRAMFKALAHDNFESYYAEHDVEELPGSHDVD
jgi:LCP family protein required for cell wall assembly